MQATRRPTLFGQLYRKEIVALRAQVVFALLGFLTLFVFLWTRRGIWLTQAITAVSVVPLMFIPFWGIWAGINSLRTEWHDKTVYYWLALPARGATLVGAKALALGTAALILYIGAGLGFAFYLWQQGLNGFTLSGPMLVVLIKDAVKMSILVLMDLMLLILLSQLSYAAGQTVHRLRWLVSGTTFFGLLWVGGRLSVNLLNALEFLGWIPLKTIGDGPRGPIVLSANMIPVAAPLLTLIAIILLFAATAWILEKRAEA